MTIIPGLHFTKDQEAASLLYCTHFPVLATLIANTKGPIAEMGMGLFSTPLLEAMVPPPRQWDSFETDPSWAYEVRSLQLPNHRILPFNPEKVPDLSGYELAIIDNGPPASRTNIALHCGARFIILHDTEPRWDYVYKWREKVFPAFKYTAHYTRLDPWTSVLSNSFDPFLFFPPGLLLRRV